MKNKEQFPQKQEQKIYKIAFIAAVPFYYQIPLFRILAKIENIDFKVYYCSDETIKGSAVEKLYASKGQFTQDNLLEGYKYKFLKNFSLAPSFLHKPFGLINLGIWNEIKKGKYDVVVLQAWNNATWFLAFIACITFKSNVYFMTDSNVLAESLKSKIKKLFRKILFKQFLFKLSTGFLTSGTANEQFYQQYGVPLRKMVHFPFSWGYEALILKSAELKSEKEEIRKSLGVEENDFVALYVGRLSQEKSPITILEAYSKITSKNKKLFLVGDGPMRKIIENKIKELKLENVFLVGFQTRESVFKFYAMADVLVLPSIQETWGIVVSEAMCFNLPIITSNHVGANLDLVKNNYNGFIFKAGNSKELSLCVTRLMDLSKDEFELFGQRSKQIIIKWVKKSDALVQVAKMLTLLKPREYR